MGGGGLRLQPVLAHRGGKKSHHIDEWIERLDGLYNHSGGNDGSLPEFAEFYDLEGSWRTFVWMETTRDEYGNWRHLPKAGGVLDQPEALMDDLQRWKDLAGRIEKQVQKWRTNKEPSA